METISGHSSPSSCANDFELRLVTIFESLSKGVIVRGSSSFPFAELFNERKDYFELDARLKRAYSLKAWNSNVAIILWEGTV